MVAQGHGNGLAQGQHPGGLWRPQAADGVRPQQQGPQGLTGAGQAHRQQVPRPSRRHQTGQPLADLGGPPLDQVVTQAPAAQGGEGRQGVEPLTRHRRRHAALSGGFQPGLLLVQIEDQEALKGDVAAQARGNLLDHLVQPPVTGGQAPEPEQGRRQGFHAPGV